MIYKFRMISGEDSAFLRDYELDCHCTFLDFHNFIQEDLDYEPSQLASFFLTDEHWNKGLELTLIDMENDAGPAAIPMESVKLHDLVKHKKERLLYVFDIFSDRGFFVELLDIMKVTSGTHYPRCSASVGDAPNQLMIEDVDLDSLALDDEVLDEIVNDIGSDEDDFGLGPEPYFEDNDER
jgi:hypothetical protein